MACNAHGIGGGVRSGSPSIDQLQETPFFHQHTRQAKLQHPNLTGRRWIEVMRLTLAQVDDIMHATGQLIANASPQYADAVSQPPAFVYFKSGLPAQSAVMRRFLS